MVCPVLQRIISTEQFPGKVKEYETLYRVASHLHDVLMNVGSVLHFPSLPVEVLKNLALSAQGITECISQVHERLTEVQFMTSKQPELQAFIKAQESVNVDNDRIELHEKFLGAEKFIQEIRLKRARE